MLCVRRVSGFGRTRENAEFLEPVASTYQGFFETKRTLFLETRPGGCCLSAGWRQRRRQFQSKEKEEEEEEEGSSGLKSRLETVLAKCLSVCSALLQEENVTNVQGELTGKDDGYWVLGMQVH